MRKHRNGDSLGNSHVSTTNYSPGYLGPLVEIGDRVQYVARPIGPLKPGAWGTICRNSGLGRVRVRWDDSTESWCYIRQLRFEKTHREPTGAPQ